MSKIILRIQTPEGQLRLNVQTPVSAGTLYKSTKELVKSDKSFNLHTARPADTKNLVKTTSRSSLKVSHGQQFFLFYNDRANVAGDSNQSDADFIAQSNQEQAKLTGKDTASESASAEKLNKIPENQIDLDLWETKFVDTTKPISLNSAMQTVDDLSVNPWDVDYLDKRGIKLMSFHSYMRMKKASVQNQKFNKLQHEVLSMQRKKSNTYNVSDLPSSITLARQNYRHVDQVIFENPDIANNFIDFWRKTNSQRIGFLYGNYIKTSEEDYPLGICANVKAIYEPPQKSFTNKIEFTDDPQIMKIHALAEALGLERVGWILSDLLVEDAANATVQNLRSKDTHFISAEEVITAASFQLQHPNITRMSENFFGSKFVTVICSGDEDKNIGFTGYQASNQCMDLVKSEIIVPTLDAPELAYVKESNDETFIPDIYYKDVDKYKNEVKKIARPMPVEFLMTDMNVTMPKQSEYTFSNKEYNYPIENRHFASQNLASFAKYLKSQSGDGISQGMLINKFTQIFRNFHLLVWMSTADMIGCTEDNIMSMIQIFNISDEFKRKQQAKTLLENETWQTLLEICREQNSFGENIEDMDDDVSEAIKRSLADH